jgi:MSHA type pilus biogenesis protein MshL
MAMKGDRTMSRERCFAMPGLRIGAIAAATICVGACGPLQEFSPAPEHLEVVAPPEGVPDAVNQLPLPPPPIAAPRQETYSVVVTDVPVRDVLFALSRDARINVDVSGEIEGNVTINAIDQTLPQILERISRQVSLRYELQSGSLVVSPDTPFWRNYRIDYVNLSRGSEGEVAVATQVATTGQGDVANGTSGGAGATTESDSGNISRTIVKSASDNDFWVLVASNIRQLVTLRGGASDGAAEAESVDPVVANPIAGVVSVYATQSQHAHVQSFVDEVSQSSKRQVLIEVTIVEVNLNDEYQAGVDWSRVSAQDGLGSNGLSFMSEMLGNSLGTPPVFTMTYNTFESDGSGFTAAVKMLQAFGDTKVLSSPRIMALNNQTALLKVVDERVYFSLEQETIEGTTNNNPRTIVTSTIRTVPVGLVMSVTPQINGNGNVSLNVRPTITRILGFAVDPAPRLIDGGAQFENLVPEIHVNEIESLLEVADGQTIVIGGLMTDEIANKSNGIPLLGRLPGIGNLFKYRDDAVKKSELVVFLRPTVIRGAGAGTPVAAAAVPPRFAP